MKGKLITTEGNESTVNFKTLLQATKIICGPEEDNLLQAIYLDNGIMLIDEQGKFKNSSINKIATGIAHLNESIYPHDFIVGNAIIIDDVDEFNSLPYE
jgi:hypothetical protein